MLIEQTKDLEQVRFIDLEFSLFWMRQGFDFYFILKLKKLKNCGFEIWNSRNLKFGSINIIVFGWGDEKLKDEIYVCVEIYLFFEICKSGRWNWFLLITEAYTTEAKQS